MANANNHSQKSLFPLNQNLFFSMEIKPNPAHYWLNQRNKYLRFIEQGVSYFSFPQNAWGKKDPYWLKNIQAISKLPVPILAHLTCQGKSKQQLDELLKTLHQLDVQHILALQGDPPQPEKTFIPHPLGFTYAYELIEYIRSGPWNFQIAAAAYPEKKNSVLHFAQKIKAGASFGLTNFLFDPESYARFQEQCHKLKVFSPLAVGTVFLRNQKQAKKIAQSFLVSIPHLAKYPQNRQEDDQNTDWAIENFLKFAAKLKSYGASGIHFFASHPTPPTSVLRLLFLGSKQR